MPPAPAPALPPSALHASALVVDAHCDIAQVMLDEERDIGRRLRSTHFDLARAAQGGLAAQFFAIWVTPELYAGERAFARALALIAAVEAAAAAHPARLAVVTTAGEVRAQHAAGRLAGILALEGAHALGTDEPRLALARVAVLVERRLRCFGLTWNNANALAGAATADQRAGLTDLGRRVVRDLERRRVLIDVSHASDRAVRDLLAIARRPILASHSNARALCGVSRNLPDDLVRAIAARGGVVCANYFAGFLDLPTFERLRRLKARAEAAADPRPPRAGAPARRHAAERRRARVAVQALPPVPLARLVAHVRHLAAVAGPAHVGLGSDFDGMWMPPAGLTDVAALPRLTAALRPHFSDDELRGILGGNVLRLLEA